MHYINLFQQIKHYTNRAQVRMSTRLSGYARPWLQYIYYKYEFESAAPKPWEIIHVDPAEISHILTPRFRVLPRYGTYVLDGRWDKYVCDRDLMFNSIDHDHADKRRCLIPFEKYGFHNSLKKHFQEDIPWEQTKFYQWMEKTSDTRNWEYYKENRFKHLDHLYQHMKENGYMSQRELTSIESAPLSTNQFPKPEYEEVLINIGRNGRLIFEDGRHRLCLAKILEIEEIPVRVFVRHKEWQDYREEILGSEDCSRFNPDHPDMGINK